MQKEEAAATLDRLRGEQADGHGRGGAALDDGGELTTEIDEQLAEHSATTRRGGRTDPRECCRSTRRSARRRMASALAALEAGARARAATRSSPTKRWSGSRPKAACSGARTAAASSWSSEHQLDESRSAHRWWSARQPGSRRDRRRARRRRSEDVIGEIAEGIGETTNNVAEYNAVIAGLELALEKGVTEIDVFLDSELVVSQLRGRLEDQERPSAGARGQGPVAAEQVRDEVRCTMCRAS